MRRVSIFGICALACMLVTYRANGQLNAINHAAGGAVNAATAPITAPAAPQAVPAAPQAVSVPAAPQAGASVQVGPGAGVSVDVNRDRGIRRDEAMTNGRAGIGVSVTGDNRPDQWRYKFDNGRWWYWTPENRWMWYGDSGWIDYQPTAVPYSANYAPATDVPAPTYYYPNSGYYYNGYYPGYYGGYYGGYGYGRPGISIGFGYGGYGRGWGGGRGRR